MWLTEFSWFLGFHVSVLRLVSFNIVIVVIHCVQKKTPTHIFFHISMNDVWI